MILLGPWEDTQLLKGSLNRRREFADLTLIDLRRGITRGIQVGKIIGDNFKGLGSSPQSRARCVVSAVHSAMLRTLSKHAPAPNAQAGQCRENMRLAALKVRSKELENSQTGMHEEDSAGRLRRHPAKSSGLQEYQANLARRRLQLLQVACACIGSYRRGLCRNFTESFYTGAI